MRYIFKFHACTRSSFRIPTMNDSNIISCSILFIPSHHFHHQIIPSIHFVSVFVAFCFCRRISSFLQWSYSNYIPCGILWLFIQLLQNMFNFKFVFIYGYVSRKKWERKPLRALQTLILFNSGWQNWITIFENVGYQRIRNQIESFHVYHLLIRHTYYTCIYLVLEMLKRKLGIL